MRRFWTGCCWLVAFAVAAAGARAGDGQIVPFEFYVDAPVEVHVVPGKALATITTRMSSNDRPP